DRSRLLSGSVGRGLGVASLLIGAGLADVDAALEERTIFDGDALGGYVAGERAFAADVDAIAGRDIAAHLAKHHNLAGGNVGSHLTVTADGETVAGQADGALDFAVDVERLRAADFAFDHQAFADGGLLARGGIALSRGGRSGARAARFKAG